MRDVLCAPNMYARIPRGIITGICFCPGTVRSSIIRLFFTFIISWLRRGGAWANVEYSVFGSQYLFPKFSIAVEMRVRRRVPPVVPGRIFCVLKIPARQRCSRLIVIERQAICSKFSNLQKQGSPRSHTHRSCS